MPARRSRRRRGRGQRRSHDDAPAASSAEVSAETGTAEAGDGEIGAVPASRTETQRGQRVQGEKAAPENVFGMSRSMFAMLSGLLVAAVALFILQIAVETDSENGSLDGVNRFPDQGRRHLAEGETFPIQAYNSYPPTSGPHDAAGVPPGLYAADQADPFNATPAFAELLPLLEAGGVVVYYDPAALPKAEVALLQNLVARLRSGQPLVSLVALPGIADREGSGPVVATAWRHVEALPDLSEDSQQDLKRFWAPAPIGLYERAVLDRSHRDALLRAPTASAP